MKLVSSIIATVMFIALLLVTYCIHIWYFPVNVVFYASITDAFIAAILAAAVLFFTGLFSRLGGFEKSQLVAIWLLGGYAFAISIPTVIDRSLSFYILEKLEQRGGAILVDRFEDVFTKEFIDEHRLVDVRLTEQQQSGTVEIVDGCAILTDRGRAIVAFSSYFRLNLLPQRRLLNGEYTDDLTNPFRESIEAPDYSCGPSLGNSN
ncbi:MAG: hypothetical protein RIE06_23110 [Roseibium album]|uniref:hypothetical protein n=1 Tax=Roseibium album TaxID=311410 RepID=UPI0018CAD60F|nr:hypothetical protein [Labrenzia sp. EL_195]MBG6210784.1 hypothetical protein [Labrenzia sp. EL_126]